MKRRFSLLLLPFLAAGSWAPAGAAFLTPDTGPVQLEPNVADAAVASNARGETVLVGVDGFEIVAQRRGPGGELRGAPVRIEGFEGSHPAAPAVGVDAAGGFVVTWLAISDFGGVPPSPDLLYQRFDPQGRPLGEVDRAFQRFVFDAPAVAVHPDGSFVVLGLGQEAPGLRGVYLQRFDAQGRTVGDAQRLSEAVLHRRYLHPRGAYDATGELLVAWSSFTCGADSCLDFRVDARRFGAGDETPGVPVEITDRGTAPAVAGLPGGGFLLAWVRPVPNDTLFHEGDFRVLARKLSGSTLGPEVEVKAEADGELDFFAPGPALAADPLGYATVFWEDGIDRDGPSEIFGQLLGPDLGLEGARQRLAREASADNSQPAAAAVGAGRFLVAWRGDSRLTAQRFRLTGEGCLPEPTRLCLEDRRFELTGTFRTRSGDEGPIRFDSLSDDSAQGWFFRPDNVEMLVKFHDGRVVNGFWWLFFAGLTNVEVELRLRDVLTGQEKTYTKPLGPLTSFADTLALPGDGGEGGVAGSRAANPAAPSAVDPLEVLSTGPAAAGEGFCLPSATTLCLADGRFDVRLERGELPAGPFMGALASPMTASAGAFWFARPTNLEVVVKVIDGRTVNGHFWVFYGSATNQGFVLTVTDTETGEVRTYERPAGPPTSFADTFAFAVP